MKHDENTPASRPERQAGRETEKDTSVGKALEEIETLKAGSTLTKRLFAALRAGLFGKKRG